MSNYSHFVLNAKRICLIVTTILIIILFIKPILQPSNKQIDFSSHSENDVKNKDLVKMTQPDFYSFNYKYGPYHILAQDVTKGQTESLLSYIKAYFDDYQKIPLIITSEIGTLFDSEKKLELKKNVVIKYDVLDLVTTLLLLNLQNFTAYTNEKVNLYQGQSILVSLKGLEASLDKKIIYFTGPIEAKYHIVKQDKYMDVSSSTMEINDHQKEAIFSKDVVVRYQNLITYSEKLVYDYKENKKGKDKIFLYKSIKLETGEEIVYAEYGMYDVTKEVLILEDNVRIFKNGNEVLGESFHYSMKDKVGKMISTPKNRVRANILHNKK